MHVVIVSSEIIGIGEQSGTGEFVAQLAMLLSSAGERVTLLYSGPLTDQVDAAAQATYGAHNIAITRISNQLKYPPFLTPMETIRCAERVDVALPPDADIVYFLQRRGNGFHTVRKHRMIAHRSLTTVSVLSGGSAWERTSQLRFARAGLGTIEINEDALENYAIEHSDHIVSPDRFMVEWMQQRGDLVSRDKQVEVLGYPVFPLPMSDQAPREPVTETAAGYRRMICLGEIEDPIGTELFVSALRTIGSERAVALHRVREIVFLYRGSGAERFETLRASVHDSVQDDLAPFNTRIEVRPWTSSATLRGLLADSVPDTLVVMPRLPPCFPYALIEALQIPGLNILCSNDGCAAELLGRTETMQLFDPYPPSLGASLSLWLEHGPRPTEALGGYHPEAANTAWLQFHAGVRKATEARRAGAGSNSRTKAIKARTDSTVKAVDVCVPYYNNAAYLPQLLASLEYQTSENFNVFVLDDGSTDPEAIEVFRRMEAKYRDRGWRFVSQANAHLGAARNAASRLGTAEFICFIDADDVASPCLIERLLEALRLTQDDCLCCYYLAFEGDEFPYIPATEEVACRVVGGLDFLGTSAATGMLFNLIGGGACSIIKRSVFERLGGFAEERYLPFEDLEFYARLLLTGYRYDVVPEYLLYYRQHAQSMLHTLSSTSQIHGWFRIEKLYAEHLKAANLAPLAGAIHGMYTQLLEAWGALDAQARQDQPLVAYIRNLEVAMRSYREAQERTAREREEALTHLRDVEHALDLVRSAQERVSGEHEEATTYVRQLEHALHLVRADHERVNAERDGVVAYVRQLEHALDLIRADHARIDTERAEAVAYAHQLEHALRLTNQHRGEHDTHADVDA